MTLKTNPFDLLDRLLEDYLSPKARRTLHTVLLLVAVAVTSVLTFEGNWQEALIAAAAAIYSWANRANTGVTTLKQAQEGFCGHASDPYENGEAEDVSEEDWEVISLEQRDPEAGVSGNTNEVY